MNAKLLLVACCFALLFGCGPTLSHTKDYSLAVGEIIEVPFEPISREQTIKVVATSPGKPIKVHVYLADDAEEVDRMLTLDKPTDLPLASQEDAEEITLEATVPAGKEVIVRLQPMGSTSADVNLQVTN